MKMSKFLNFSVFVFVISLVFTACSEDETLIIVPSNGQQETFFSVANDDDDDLDLEELCFDFVYPINLVSPDGSTTVLNSDADLEAAIQTSIVSGVEPTFNYPIQVETEDNVIVNVADDEALCDLMFECFDEYEGECFEFNFPITMTLSDGSNVTANDWDEFETILDNYYSDPQNVDEITLVYPISVTMLDDGTVVTINNDAEGEALAEQCYGGFEFDCFEFVFPLSFTMSDGSTISGNDDEELMLAFEAYIGANPNDTIAPTFNYPVSVTHFDGTTETINNDAELETLFMDCFGDEWDGFGKIAPIDVVLSSKSSVEDKAILRTVYAKNIAASKGQLSVD
jgi:hypothetical protein